jgi:hypothetical protein
MALTINVPPIGDASYNGYYYAYLATGGYVFEKALPTILLSTTNPVNKYDVTDALQVKFDVRTFNQKIGLLKDASNINIIDTSFSNSMFPNDSITLTAQEFVAGMTAAQVISVGTYGSLYTDFNNYVNNYFNYAGTFSSVFSSVSQVNYYNGVFDGAAVINLLTGYSVTPSGDYVKDLSGSITINNINNMLYYDVSNNVFGNRGAGAKNGADYTIQDGFIDGDLIYVPAGTTVTLKLNVDSQGILNDNTDNTGPVNDASLSISTTFTSKLVNGVNNPKFTEASQATYTLISRTLTAPLLIRMSNLW